MQNIFLVHFVLSHSVPVHIKIFDALLAVFRVIESIEIVDLLAQRPLCPGLPDGLIGLRVAWLLRLSIRVRGLALGLAPFSRSVCPIHLLQVGSPLALVLHCALWVFVQKQIPVNVVFSLWVLRSVYLFSELVAPIASWHPWLWHYRRLDEFLLGLTPAGDLPLVLGMRLGFGVWLIDFFWKSRSIYRFEQSVILSQYYLLSLAGVLWRLHLLNLLK